MCRIPEVSMFLNFNFIIAPVFLFLPNPNPQSLIEDTNKQLNKIGCTEHHGGGGHFSLVLIFDMKKTIIKHACTSL